MKEKQQEIEDVNANEYTLERKYKNIMITTRSYEEQEYLRCLAIKKQQKNNDIVKQWRLISDNDPQKKYYTNTEEPVFIDTDNTFVNRDEVLQKIYSDNRKKAQFRKIGSY